MSTYWHKYVAHSSFGSEMRFRTNASYVPYNSVTGPTEEQDQVPYVKMGIESDPITPSGIDGAYIQWLQAELELNATTIKLVGNVDVGEHYIDIEDISTPSNPATGVRRLFTNTATGELSVRTSGGSTVSLEAAAGIQNVVEDLTPALGGPLELNGKNITEEYTAAVALVNGNLCYLNSSGKMAKTDANTEALSIGMLALCLETIAADNTGTFLMWGTWTTTGLTQGSTYYVSTTLGGITTTEYSTSGYFIRIIGTALSTTKLFFNPSRSWIKYA